MILYHRRRSATTTAPSMFPSSRAIRSPRRCAPRRRSAREVIFLEPDSAERPHLPDTYPDTYAIQRIGLEHYIEAYRVWPQPRTEEVTAHAAAMAWKLQGADPDASVVVVVSLNLLDPLLDAMETPQDAARARRKTFDVAAAESASGLPGRDHHRVSLPAGALRIFPAGSATATMRRWTGRASSSICCARRRRSTPNRPAKSWRTGSGA